MDMIKHTYLVADKKVTGKVDVEFSDVNEDFSFKVTGPIGILSKICGGLGKENFEQNTVVITEKELKSESQRLYVLTELAQLASK
jgi:hypothetical protein